jgi:hypothetical protein
MSVNVENYSQEMKTLTHKLTEKVKSAIDHQYATNPQNTSLTSIQIATIIKDKSNIALSDKDFKILSECVSKRISALVKHKKLVRSKDKPFRYSPIYAKHIKFSPTPNIDDLQANLAERQIEKLNQGVATASPCKHIQLLATTLSTPQLKETINFLNEQLYVTKDQYDQLLIENKKLQLELQSVKKEWKDRVEPLVLLIEKAANM